MFIFVPVMIGVRRRVGCVLEGALLVISDTVTDG